MVINGNTRGSVRHPAKGDVLLPEKPTKKRVRTPKDMSERFANRFAKLTGKSADEILEAASTPSDFDKKKDENYPNLDLFVCDLSDVSPKSDRNSLQYPFFRLSHKTNRKIFTYQDGENFIQIIPSIKGAATLFDKDVLVFAISHLIDAMNKGKPISNVVEFSIYDFMVACNKGHRVYEDIVSALERLDGCRIRTTIKAGGKTIDSGFGMIDGFQTERDDKTLKGKVKIKLSDYIFSMIQHKQVLTLSRDYFLLRKPFDRMLYNVARKFCGRQPAWKVSLEKLHLKSGSDEALRRFRTRIKKVEAENSIPDYKIMYDCNDGNELVLFVRRNSGIETKEEARQQKLF